MRTHLRSLSFSFSPSSTLAFMSMRAYTGRGVCVCVCKRECECKFACLFALCLYRNPVIRSPTPSPSRSRSTPLVSRMSPRRTHSQRSYQPTDPRYRPRSSWLSPPTPAFACTRAPAHTQAVVYACSSACSLTVTVVSSPMCTLLYPPMGPSIGYLPLTGTGGGKHTNIRKFTRACAVIGRHKGHRLLFIKDTSNRPTSVLPCTEGLYLSSGYASPLRFPPLAVAQIATTGSVPMKSP